MPAESMYRFVLTVDAAQAVAEAQKARQAFEKAFAGMSTSGKGGAAATGGFGPSVAKAAWSEKAAEIIIRANGRVAASWDRVNDEFKDIEGPTQALGAIGQGADESAQRIAALSRASTGAAAAMDKAWAEVKASNVATEATSRAIEQTGQGAAKSVSSVDDLGRSLRQMSEDGERISFIGMRLGALGAGILLPAMAASSAYIQSAGQFENVSATWLRQTGEIEDAHIRVGRVVTQQLLPAMSTAADLADRIASMAEQYPQIVNAGLLVGGGLAGAGAMVTVAGQAVQMGAKAGILLQQAGLVSGAATTTGATGGAATAAGAGALGVAGLTTAAAGGGALLGYGGAKLLGYQGGLDTAAADIVKYQLQQVLIPVGALGIGLERLGIISGDTANSLGQTIAQVGNLGQVSNATNSALSRQVEQSLMAKTFGPQMSEAFGGFVNFEKQATEATRQYEKTKADQERAYQQQAAESESDYQQRRGDLEREGLRQLAETESDYRDQVSRAQDDFARNERRAGEDLATRIGQATSQRVEQEQQAERDYYGKRQDLAEKFGAETLQREQDFQQQQQRLQEDHATRLGDLVRTRDARGVVAEMRVYDTERQRREQDFGLSSGRRNAEYSRQLQDLEQSFSAQRERRITSFQEQISEITSQAEEQKARRLEDFQTRQAEQLAEFEERRSKEQLDRDARLVELDANFADERGKRATQQQQRLSDMAAEYQSETDLRRQAFDESLLMLQTTSDRYLSWLQQRMSRFDEYLATQQAQYAATSSASAGRAGVIGMAAGGYASGPIMTGEQGREFVLNASTTRSMERNLGSLSQEKMMRFGGRSEHVIRFDGVPSGISQAGLERVVREVLTRDISDYMASRN